MFRAASVLAAAASLISAPAGAETWSVRPAAGRCEASVTLAANSGERRAALTFASAGAETHMELAAPEEFAPAAFVPLTVDGRRYGAVAQNLDGRLSLHLTPQLARAIARGSRLTVGFLPDRPLTASLAGSARGLADLTDCGRQIQAAVAETGLRTDAAALAAEAAAAQEEARARRQAHLETARRQHQALAITRQTADLLLGSGPPESATRTYTFPDGDQVTCRDGLHGVVCD